MGVVGSDIDGVIAPNPWITRYWPGSGDPIVQKPLRAFPASWDYIFRRPYPKAIEWVKERQAAGDKILLISGIYIFAWPFIWLWLKLWKFPHDGLHLRLRGSQPEFKAKAVFKLGCTMFIDDRKDVIAAIAKQFLLDGFKEVNSYQNELGYVVFIGDINNRNKGVLAQ